MKMRAAQLCWITASSLLLAVVCSPALEAQKGSSALGDVGTTWGGEHVRLQVTSDGASLDFDCASGTITKPLTADAQGNFNVKGTFTREHPGPVMRDGNTAAAATYSGTITGNTMRLTIVAGPQNESMGEYVLVRGQPGRVFKCK